MGDSEEVIETFGPFGVSNITIDLAVATPANHLSLCSSQDPQFEVACRTGLRVYEGSRACCSLMELSSFSSMVGMSHVENVIEIGCGCGLVGILYKILFPQSRILLTDGERLAVERTKRNVVKTFGSEAVNTEVFSWDVTSASNLVARYGAFDLCIGCELIYFKVSLDSLLDTISALLKPDGLALLVHVPRIEGGGRRVSEAAQRKGLAVLRGLYSHLTSAFGGESVRDGAYLNSCEVVVLSKNSLERLAPYFPEATHNAEPQLPVGDDLFE
jgi:precorrin-6B methylase 2